MLGRTLSGPRWPEQPHIIVEIQKLFRIEILLIDFRQGRIELRGCIIKFFSVVSLVKASGWLF